MPPTTREGAQYDQSKRLRTDRQKAQRVIKDEILNHHRKKREEKLGLQPFIRRKFLGPTDKQKKDKEARDGLILEAKEHIAATQLTNQFKRQDYRRE